MNKTTQGYQIAYFELCVFGRRIGAWSVKLDVFIILISMNVLWISIGYAWIKLILANRHVWQYFQGLAFWLEYMISIYVFWRRFRICWCFFLTELLWFLWWASIILRLISVLTNTTCNPQSTYKFTPWVAITLAHTMVAWAFIIKHA